MFERVRRPIKPLIAAIIFGVALAGCTKTTEAEPYHDPYHYSIPAKPEASKNPTPPEVYPDGVAMNGLKACFKTPPSETKRAENDDWKDARIVLQPDAKTDSIVGDPGPLAPKVENKVRGAIVQVDDEAGKGSGFLVEPDVVVTAAHVPDHKDITVTDSKGKAAKVIGGCYIHQDKGKPVDLSEERAVTTDIAVLKLDRKIGSSVLKIAAAPAARGSWVTFANAQGASTAQNPAIYNGLALTGDSNEMGASVLSGVTRRGSKDFHTYTAVGGSSGGAVVNRQGEVVGVSFASWDGNRSDSINHSLIHDYGVHPPLREDNPNHIVDQVNFGWRMNASNIVAPPMINLALSSLNY